MQLTTNVKDVNPMESLKEKIDWMLDGGYLIDKDKESNDYLYGIDTSAEEVVFYSILKRQRKARNPRRLIQDPQLPLSSIDWNMKIFKD